MPCGAIENVDDRDYIKSLKKAVLVGNDLEEKACLCECRVPTTSEGCPVLDEDHKVGLFPFCIPLVDESTVGENTNYPIKMTLKQVMDLYWGKKLKIKASVKGNSPMENIYNPCTTECPGNGQGCPNGCPCCPPCTTKRYVVAGLADTLSGKGENVTLDRSRKELLCGPWHKIGLSEDNGGKVFRCGNTNYDADCTGGEGLYFGVTVQFFVTYGVYPEIVKTSDDNENVDFYPRMSLGMNLGGGLAGGVIWTIEGGGPYDQFGASSATVKFDGKKLEDVVLGGGKMQYVCPPDASYWVNSNLQNEWNIIPSDFVP